MRLLHNIIKKSLAKYYYPHMVDKKPYDFEEPCTADPKDGPFYLPLGYAPKMIRDFVNWRNGWNSDYPDVKGLLCFNDRIDIHADEPFGQKSCIYALNPLISIQKHGKVFNKSFVYDGRRTINGRTVLAYHKELHGQNYGAYYLTDNGDFAFDLDKVEYRDDEYFHSSERISLFDESVMKIVTREGPHCLEHVHFLSLDSENIYRKVVLDSFDQYIIDGKGYLFGKIDGSPLAVYNLYDREGNLYSGHGGPFYKISHLNLKLFENDLKDIIYAQKRVGDIFRFYDRNGKTVEAFGMGKPGRTLGSIFDYDGRLYGVTVENQGAPWAWKIFSYDGTDMLIDNRDMDQFLPFVREYVGDDDFDSAFAGFYEHLLAFGKVEADRKIGLELLQEVDDYARSKYDDKDERVRCITACLNSMDDGIFNIFDNPQEKSNFSEKDKHAYQRLVHSKYVWIKKLFSNIKELPSHLGTKSHVEETLSYLEYVTKMCEDHPGHFESAIDLSWYSAYQKGNKKHYFGELLGFFDTFENFPNHLRFNSGFESQINEFVSDMESLTNNYENDSFDPTGVAGWLDFLQTSIMDEKSGMQSYLSTISFERFSKVGFTQVIMLDSFGLLKKYDQMSTSLDNLNLGQRELYQAHDSISETMDMVLERSKRRHTSPRDDISDFLDNVNRSFIDAPNMSVEYMKVAA